MKLFHEWKHQKYVLFLVVNKKIFSFGTKHIYAIELHLQGRKLIFDMPNVFVVVQKILIEYDDFNTFLFLKIYFYY